MGNANLALQLERLRRHYEIAARTYDQVSFLDLSHSLRIWVDLKGAVATSAPAFVSTLGFKTCAPSKDVLRVARGRPFAMSYTANRVRTWAANGSLIHTPQIDRREPFSSAVRLMQHEDGSLELGNFAMIHGELSDPDEGARLSSPDQRPHVTRLNYPRWLAAEVVRLRYLRDGSLTPLITVSREMLVKRVANTLGGSHPESPSSGGQANSFDEPIQVLMQYLVGALPLPYFILLGIAQDILEVAPRLLERRA